MSTRKIGGRVSTNVPPVVLSDDEHDGVVVGEKDWYICLVCYRAFPKSEQLSVHKEGQHGISKFNRTAFILSHVDLMPNIVLRNESNLRVKRHTSRTGSSSSSTTIKVPVMPDCCLSYLAGSKIPTEKGPVTATRCITKHRKYKYKGSTDKELVKKKLAIAKQLKMCKLNADSSKPYHFRQKTKKQKERRHQLWDVAKDSFCPSPVVEDVIPKIEGYTLEDSNSQESTVKLDTVFEMIPSIRADILELKRMLRVVNLGRPNIANAPTSSSPPLDAPQEGNIPAVNFNARSSKRLNASGSKSSNYFILQTMSSQPQHQINQLMHQHSSDQLQQQQSPSTTSLNDDNQFAGSTKTIEQNEGRLKHASSGSDPEKSKLTVYENKSGPAAGPSGVPPKKRKKLSPVLIHEHITILSGEPQMYQCKICSKKFKTKRHIKYHEFCQKNREKPFKCEQCNLGFITKPHYEYHLRTHAGELPYLCPKCGRGFNQKGKVIRHMRSHTGERPFICQTCGRGFSNVQAMRAHSLVHTGDRPFACPHCSKRFTAMTNLKKHIITHTGPHKCVHCGKRFSIKLTLDIHIKTHSSERLRPYACGQCTRAFSISKDLRRHLVIHSGERPFKCWLCETEFRRKDNLDRHIKNTHNQTKEQLTTAEYLASRKNSAVATTDGSVPSNSASNVLRMNSIVNTTTDPTNPAVKTRRANFKKTKAKPVPQRPPSVIITAVGSPGSLSVSPVVSDRRDVCISLPIPTGLDVTALNQNEQNPDVSDEDTNEREFSDRSAELQTILTSEFVEFEKNPGSANNQDAERLFAEMLNIHLQ